MPLTLPAMSLDPTITPPIVASGDDKEPRRKGNVQTKERPKVKRPKMYKVLLHNDHYTTMEFVVWILMGTFRRSEAEATRIMLAIHKGGLGIAGVYTKEVAETKVRKVVELARKNDYPLQCTYEEA